MPTKTRPSRTDPPAEGGALSASCGQLESFDVDEYAQSVKPWDVRLDQISGGRFHARMQYVMTPGMVAYEERWSRPVHVRGTTPQGYFTLGTNVAPQRSPIIWCGRSVDAERLACRSSAGGVDFKIPENSHQVVLLVRSELLARSLGEETYARLSGLKHLDLQACDGRRLLAMIRRAVRMNRTAPEPFLSVAQVAATESRLLETLSLAIESSPGDDHGPSSFRVASVRRAIAYADQSPEPITALQLAGAVGVCQRTLEYGFREMIGCTPARYLRLLRLNNAHRELLAADPETTTVTRVALAWGFGHLGRFAIEHRRLFGEPPSVTLNRPQKPITPWLIAG